MKPKLREGDIMRVKGNGALVRLVLPENPNEAQILIDANGYVYVEPITETDKWYHIKELEPAARPEPSRAEGGK